jgi:hypothetical protein
MLFGCVWSNGYFFFFLAFFAFFAFFAFLAMLPSVVPKVRSDTARFEEGKRPPHRRDLRPDEALA